MAIFKGLNERQVKALVDEHCGLYEKRLRRASESPFIRVDECNKLLAIWRSIGTKLTLDNWRFKLTRAEICEIEDAVSSGDYDAVLRAHQERPS